MQKNGAGIEHLIRRRLLDAAKDRHGVVGFQSWKRAAGEERREQLLAEAARGELRID
jgi:hypothetical protein